MYSIMYVTYWTLRLTYQPPRPRAVKSVTRRQMEKSVGGPGWVAIQLDHQVTCLYQSYPISEIVHQLTERGLLKNSLAVAKLCSQIEIYLRLLVNRMYNYYQMIEWDLLKSGFAVEKLCSHLKASVTVWYILGLRTNNSLLAQRQQRVYLGPGKWKCV